LRVLRRGGRRAASRFYLEAAEALLARKAVDEGDRGDLRIGFEPLGQRRPQFVEPLVES
jgi:hypothetical protein